MLDRNSPEAVIIAREAAYRIKQDDLIEDVRWRQPGQGTWKPHPCRQAHGGDKAAFCRECLRLFPRVAAPLGPHPDAAQRL